MNNNQQTQSAPGPQQVVYVTSGKSRAAYIILGLFFGGMGIHDFYAGYAGKGLMKIIVSFVGAFLFFGGGFAVAVSSAVDGVNSTPEGMATMPAIGLAMLGFQSLYILIQICSVTRDSKGVPFC